MKRFLRNAIAIICIMASSAIALTGCAEHHYYHRYHHHTRDWYGRHHTTPPSGVNFDIDVR